MIVISHAHRLKHRADLAPRIKRSISARFRVVNEFGWHFCFEVAGESVVVTRSYRGAPVGAEVEPVEAARLHYRSLLRQGFRKLEVA